MALTTVVRMHLEGKRFNDLFDRHQADWAAMAHKARATMTSHIGEGSLTLDDIKKILQPMVEVDPRLRDHMIDEKATGKHWIGDFSDYILDRVYNPKLPPQQE